MSAEAAKAFGISQADLDEFLDISKAENVPVNTVSEATKHTILVVSIILFVLAIVTCGCTVFLWLVSKKRKERPYSKLDDSTDKADLAYNDSPNGPLKTENSLPQLTEKPKLQSNITFPEKEPFEEEELKNLRVEKLDLSASFYTNRDRVQVMVRRIMLSAFDNKLVNNAYIYVVVALLPDKSAFYESELRPIAEENYFEEASEFDVVGIKEIAERILRVSIYACDRFSQHRLVNEYTYNLFVKESDEVETPSILPVVLNQASRSLDNQATHQSQELGEVLFSLCYMPTSGRLTFVALKGRNISDEKETPLATYLRVSLLVAGKSMKTVQTSSIRRSSSPVYNEAFVFHTPLERIKDTDIIVSVMTTGHNSSSPKMLGKVVVGPESGNNFGRKHWEAMLTSPRKPTAQWHILNQQE